VALVACAVWQRAQMRDEMVCRAVLKLQAAIRGRIARSKMAVRRGSIP
jgi:hypothetical protein